MGIFFVTGLPDQSFGISSFNSRIQGLIKSSSRLAISDASNMTNFDSIRVALVAYCECSPDISTPGGRWPAIKDNNVGASISYSRMASPQKGRKY